MLHRLCRRIKRVDDEKSTPLPTRSHTPQSSSSAVIFKSVSSTDTLLLSGSTTNNGARIVPQELARKRLTRGLWFITQMTFFQNIRNGLAEYLPAFIRSVARHESGHTLGLDHPDNCSPGSTIMLLGNGETFITACDNNKIKTDPTYPPPPAAPPGPAYHWNTTCNCWVCRLRAPALAVMESARLGVPLAALGFIGSARLRCW